MRHPAPKILSLTAALLGACTPLPTRPPERATPTYRPSAAQAAQATDGSLFAHPWTWTDEFGRPVTLSRWRGGTLVVTGIYTQCKSTCPRTVAKLRKLHDGFVNEGRTVQFLLVTLDPDSDTPTALMRFKASAALPDSWHLLTGSAQDTQELSDILDIHVLDDGPHFMHDGKIVIFDAGGLPLRRFGGWALDEEESRPSGTAKRRGDP